MNFFKKAFNFISPSFYLSRTKTVRYAFPVFLAIAASISLASLMGSSGAEIVLESNKSSLAVDDEFSVSVYAIATTPVNAVSLKIDIPTNMVDVRSIDIGESVITLWTSDPRLEGGTVILEGGTYRKGFVGKHLIATINVKAKAAGQTSLDADFVNLLAGDGKGTTVPTESKQLSLGVANKNADASINKELSLVIIGDIDGNGEVGLADIQQFMADWTKKTNVHDFNNDGTTSFKDFSIILSHFFKGN